ncbi:MAG: NGG1p interacting factor NIF3 [Psychrobacter sp.]|nr:NGG1p interacting factor NIF3 [Psychrobacter sp.]
MYKLTVFIPDEALDEVKNALFEAGAGQIGNYSHCCWQIKGQGQFKPTAGSNPYLGKQNQLEQVIEWRVEMVVTEERIKPVITALKQVHPYETPAYDVIKTVEF